MQKDSGWKALLRPVLKHPRLRRRYWVYRMTRSAKLIRRASWIRKFVLANYKRDLEPRSRVLIATSAGGHLPGSTLESVLAAALHARGAQVDVLLCDAALPACQMCTAQFFPDQRRFIATGPQKDLCGMCFGHGRKLYESLGFKVHRYSDWVTVAERADAARASQETPMGEIPTYAWEGLAVGEHALAGALRFFARATLDESSPETEPILRRYFQASLITAYAIRRLLRAERFDVAAFHHGIYVPQGVIGEACRQHGVRVVNWNPAYRKESFIFSHGDTYHHTLMSEPTTAWEDMAWPPEREQELMSYLKSRWYGTQDWIWFHDQPVEDLSVIGREIGVDFSKPSVALLTNVLWDAQLHYPANAFPNMLDWIVHTIRYFAQRPEVQLLIRVHPAEIRGAIPSRQNVVEEIRRVFPVLPPNVFIIPPESQVSTYALVEQCNAAIIYGTKTGVELTAMGIPTIVAGEAWIRNKGITLDASSIAEYNGILNRLPFPSRLDEATVQRARRYAYHFFFRRMIPVPFMQPSREWALSYTAEITGPDSLLPGGVAGLDVICDGIMHGRPFVYDSEAGSHSVLASTRTGAAVPE